MTDFIAYSNIIIGVLLIVAALALHTKNFASAVVFKIIPFFAGLVLFINAGFLLGFFISA